MNQVDYSNVAELRTRLDGIRGRIDALVPDRPVDLKGIRAALTASQLEAESVGRPESSAPLRRLALLTEVWECLALEASDETTDVAEFCGQSLRQLAEENDDVGSIVRESTSRWSDYLQLLDPWSEPAPGDAAGDDLDPSGDEDAAGFDTSALMRLLAGSCSAADADDVSDEPPSPPSDKDEEEDEEIAARAPEANEGPPSASLAWGGESKRVRAHAGHVGERVGQPPSAGEGTSDGWLGSRLRDPGARSVGRGLEDETPATPASSPQPGAAGPQGLWKVGQPPSAVDSQPAAPGSQSQSAAPSNEARALNLDPEFRDAFLGEAADLFERIEALVLDLGREPDPAPILHELCRCCHTLKGAAGSVGLSLFAGRVHALEDRLEAAAGVVSDDVLDQLNQLLSDCEAVLLALRRAVRPSRPRPRSNTPPRWWLQRRPLQSICRSRRRRGPRRRKRRCGSPRRGSTR